MCAKINDTTAYPVVTPANLDRLLGSDVSNTTNDANGETSSFRVQDILGTQHNHTLSDVTDAGTAAGYDVGTGANQVVQLDAGAKIPAIDSSQTTHAVPTGGIIMWSGAVSAIPTGWAICDGLNGTPDLTGRFVVHADADAAGTYAPGDVGGNNSITAVPAHTHDEGTLVTASNGGHSHNQGTLATNSTGAHTHDFSGNRADVDNGIYGSSANVLTNLTNAANGTDSNITSSEGSHSHNVSGDTGTNGAHTHAVSGSVGSTGSASVDVRPLFYALAYIMKT